MAEIQESSIRASIESIVDPTFERTLLELGTLENLNIIGERVEATIRLSTPAQIIKQRIQNQIEENLRPLGITFVEITWNIRTPTRDTTSEDLVPDIRNIILVMSGKGGVGKSTIASNLALALRRQGLRTGLLDADIYGPSIPTLLGITGQPISKDGKKIKPLERFGLKLMSIGFLLEDPKQAVVWRGPMLHGALQQFLSDVDWGPLDYLVMDLPPGTGDVALSISQKVKITGVVIVTTPQEVALQDVYKGVSMCQKLNLPILGVVENMSYFIDSAGMRHEIFGSGGGQAVAQYANAPLLGKIPIETLVRKWGDQGTPIVQAQPDCEAAKELTQIADTLTERIARDHFVRGGGEQVPTDQAPKRLKIIR